MSFLFINCFAIHETSHLNGINKWMNFSGIYSHYLLLAWSIISTTFFFLNVNPFLIVFFFFFHIFVSSISEVTSQYLSLANCLFFFLFFALVLFVSVSALVSML